MQEALPSRCQTAAPIRVAIAEDYGLVREALRHLLMEQSDIEVVAEAADGDDAVRVATSTAIDVLLLDLAMPRMSGLQAIPRIRAVAPDLAIVVLSSHPAATHGPLALRAGACAYVEKVTAVDRLLAAIRSAVAGCARRSTRVMHLPA